MEDFFLIFYFLVCCWVFLLIYINVYLLWIFKIGIFFIRNKIKKCYVFSVKLIICSMIYILVVDKFYLEIGEVYIYREFLYIWIRL